MALTYQWYKDGSPISGATSATYTKPSAVEGDAGSYYCRVTNAFGSVNSNAATVTVDANTLLLVQVDADGNIVERTGNGTITTTGTVIVDHTTTHDGFGSIRNTALGSATATGITEISCNLTNAATIEGWICPLSPTPSQALWLAARSSSFDSVIGAALLGEGKAGTVGSEFYANVFGDALIETSVASTRGQFHHIAFVFNGTIVTLYINGSNSGNASYGSVPSLINLFVGGYNSPSLWNACCWENIRVSNIARYTTNFTPPGRF